MDLGRRAPSRCRAVHRAPTQARGQSLRAACNSHRAQPRGAGRGQTRRAPTLLCFGFASGGRRRSEIAAADLRDLRRIGEAGYIYRLEHSKTQQAGVTATSTPDKPVLDRAALALQDWLDAAGITEGAIFRRLWKQRVGPALSPAAIGEIVQRRARLAGLEGDFGGHSLRSGFVTEASRQGVSLPAIMQLTEHRAVSSVVGYFQSGGATCNPAARLLET